MGKRKGSRRQGRRQGLWSQATVDLQPVPWDGTSRKGLSDSGWLHIDHQMQLLSGSRALDKRVHIVRRWEICAGASASQGWRKRSVKPGGGGSMATTTATTKQHVGHCSSGTVHVLELGVPRTMDASGRRSKGVRLNRSCRRLETQGHQLDGKS